MSKPSMAFGKNAWIHKPTDIHITDTFIVLGGAPVALGPDVTGRFARNVIYRLDGYTPRICRRRRLRRFAPVVRRARACRSLWRWMNGKRF